MSKFIEIHIGEKDSPRLINLDYVKYISGGSIVRNEGGPICCNETYEEIREKIVKAGALDGNSSCE